MATLTMEEGVSCESCHGPGSAYKKMKTMKGLAAGTIEPASVGLIADPKKNCTKCHNSESPTFKEFNLEKQWAKIKHAVPKK